MNLTQIQDYPTLTNAITNPFGDFSLNDISAQTLTQREMNGNINTTNSSGSPSSWISEIGSFFSFLTSGQGWTRIGLVIVGLIFVFVGLMLMGSRHIDIKNVIQSGKAVA